MTQQTETQRSPCVSVIIPTYNRRALLGRAVDSALKQTEQDIEVIIADDGSTDGTEALFAGETDPRVRYCRLHHAGACAARNAGIDLARGKYIAFLDSDDVWRPDKLAVQKRQLETSGADVVFCAFLRHSLRDDTAERCPTEDVPEGKIDYRRLLSGNLVSTQTIFGKAACMKRIRFDERFPRMQDWEYAIRLARDCRLHYFSDVLADVYLQKDSISVKPELGLKAMRLLHDKYRADYKASPEDTMAAMMTLHHYALQCGRCCAADYARMLPFRQGLRSLLRLAMWGLRFGVKELLVKMNGTRKAHR